MRLTEVAVDPKTKIENLIKRYKLKNCTINDDLLVDVDGSISFYHNTFTKLPIPFGHVKGSFLLHSCEKLITLEGTPQQVDKNFIITNSPLLMSLEHGPTRVDGSYGIVKGKLKNLEHVPTVIGEDFYIQEQGLLTSLKGCPKQVGGYFSLFDCRNLPELDYLPESIKGTFNTYWCHKIRNVLKIFNIKGVKEFSCKEEKVKIILNKYLPTRDMLNCQDELIEAGLEQYAEIDK